MTICIIPARGGSKRLPRKNILPYKDQPLIRHVVAAARASNVFDEVIVSSEDDEILEIAVQCGANAYQRELSIAGDRSTVVEVCLDVLSKNSTEIFCCIYPTAVLLSSETISTSKALFDDYGEGRASVLMGVSEYNYHPVQALSLEEDGSGTPMFPEFRGVQSQFYPRARVSNGTFYWGRKSRFEIEKSFYSEKLKLYDVPDLEVCDIDTPEDYSRLLLRG